MRETHGRTGTAMYARYKQIKQRTGNPNSKNYHNYGGRGITMCEEWRQSYTAFLAYMGEPPFPKATIERIDNDKGYEPGNVRWATYAEQIYNQRNRSSKYKYPGVRRTKDTYWSQITINGKRVYLGSFTTPEAASAAYNKAKEEHVISVTRLSGRDVDRNP